eukprot:m.286407 g.286407  ORF g.286407 m.286407 type:complete len:515 (-) comp11566_c0_seq1:161-1705(-)
MPAFKSLFGSDIRRFRLEPADLSLRAICAKLAAVYELPIRASLLGGGAVSLKWKDADGDLVTISTDDDLAEALRSSGEPIRLIVTADESRLEDFVVDISEDEDSDTEDDVEEEIEEIKQEEAVETPLADEVAPDMEFVEAETPDSDSDSYCVVGKKVTFAEPVEEEEGKGEEGDNDSYFSSHYALMHAIESFDAATLRSGAVPKPPSTSSHDKHQQMLSELVQTVAVCEPVTVSNTTVAAPGAPPTGSMLDLLHTELKKVVPPAPPASASSAAPPPPPAPVQTPSPRAALLRSIVTAVTAREERKSELERVRKEAADNQRARSAAMQSQLTAMLAAVRAADEEAEKRKAEEQQKAAQEAEAEAETESDSDDAADENEICNECRTPVDFRYFKCATCPSYTVCSECEGHGAHYNHILLRMQRGVSQNSVLKWVPEGQNNSDGSSRQRTRSPRRSERAQLIALRQAAAEANRLAEKARHAYQLAADKASCAAIARDQFAEKLAVKRAGAQQENKQA